MTELKIKKTLQPLIVGEKIVFGLGQDGIERSIEKSEMNIDIIKVLNGEKERSELKISEEKFNNKINVLKNLGLLTTNEYDKKYKYSRNINFFEWMDISNNINPSIYQQKLNEAHVLIVGLGGIGSNVCEILTRLGIKTFTIIDNDVIDESNLTRQGTYFKEDLGKNKADIVDKYIKKIDPNVNVNKINKYISTKDDLKDIFKEYNFDISICCADTPKYKIDVWFDELSIEFNKPFISGSYASTVINTFCMNPNITITSSELYGEQGASREQLLENISFPTSVIAPITYMAAGLISYQAQSVITQLNYKPEAIQIDLFDWNIYKYDLSKK
ncbi:MULTISPECIES: ThiF family adenylyltransferase [unclassified Lysinibacillus]|uniref:ThiF family adenylyltransferase n=1 Tax=unclassified Lysinibacillus TaxID=2636778 RepID=UPI0025540038|nr:MULTISPECIES: ThiF family adenylyltransferase [unclassified Lysinibacillus]MDM5249287.1 ThiF family adenylyltransferase [Lysinibacillus sp. G4S2]